MMYHVPALQKEVFELARFCNRNFIFIDATFGGGGHTALLLSLLHSEGKVFAFDRDKDAENVYRSRTELTDDKRLVFLPRSFSEINVLTDEHYIEPGTVDFILADLGISSHQIDEPQRGFSYRYDAPLDMRMNVGQILTAAHVVNTYPVDDLASVLKYYGELSRSTVIAKEIVASRPIETTFQLNKAVEKFKPRFDERKFWSKLYQAIRMEVNDEINELKTFLVESEKLLAPGGMLAVITYHSIEDRLVKHFLATGNMEGEIKTDFFGKKVAPFVHPVPRSVTPQPEEIEQNKRIRSARLRYNTKI